MTTQEIYTAAREFGACGRFKGTEDRTALTELFFTPQGTEFCTKNNFPDMETFRTFKGEESAQQGLYVDAGAIRQKNRPRIALIGDTQAILTYDDPSQRHEVILMHGAKAVIEASGYAVVFVTNGGGEVKQVTSGNAKIL